MSLNIALYLSAYLISGVPFRIDIGKDILVVLIFREGGEVVIIGATNVP